jgi:hypothetical protein
MRDDCVINPELTLDSRVFNVFVLGPIIRTLVRILVRLTEVHHFEVQDPPFLKEAGKSSFGVLPPFFKISRGLIGEL